MQIAALASGTGTVLSALIEEGLPISVVVVDRPCRAEDLARAAQICVESLYREDFSAGFDRDGYTEKVVAALSSHRVDLVVMAGYGTVLSRAIHEAYQGRILNTHPALLPSFKGWHAVRDALHYGVKVTGCTVHVATEEVDKGPILAQEAVPVLDGDTEESLHERIKMVERRLYPATVKAALRTLEQGGVLS